MTWAWRHPWGALEECRGRAWRPTCAGVGGAWRPGERRGRGTVQGCPGLKRPVSGWIWGQGQRDPDAWQAPFT